jgi:hypothetical protein
LIWNKHDQRQSRMISHMVPVAENPMLQRAFPIQHPYTALDEKHGADGPSNVRRLVGAFSGHLLRLLRLLGRFAAAGGPLS